LTILNTNLVFGKESYLFHYLTQCVAAGKVKKSIGGSTKYKYQPISSEDLASAVEAALSRTDEVKGKRFLVNGADTTTIRDLIPLLEKKLGLPEG